MLIYIGGCLQQRVVACGSRWCHAGCKAMLSIEIEREEDGRWIAEVPALPGVLAYGATAAEARNKATALALRVMADRIEHGEAMPAEADSLFIAA